VNQTAAESMKPMDNGTRLRGFLESGKTAE
jgi:hypothetical protein